jgi:hypothetical protein
MSNSFKQTSCKSLALGLLLVVSATVMLAAQGEKKIDCGVAVSNDAVVITKTTVKDRVVECMAAPGPPNGRGPYQKAPAFLADDDWLENVTIYFFNRTNKTIVAADIIIGFPQTGDGGSPATAQRSYTIILGRRPTIANFHFRTGKQMPNDGTPLSFRKEQTLAVHLRDHIEAIRENIRDRLFVPVTEIMINPIQFIFDDGMSWNGGGQFSVPDEEHPGKWKHLPFTFFPGDVRANWPPEGIGKGRK